MCVCVCFFSTLSAQVRGDLPSLHLAHDVEAVPGGEVRGGDLAAGALPRRAAGHPVRHHRRLRR